MKHFLEEIAEKILQEPPYQSDKSIVVFPNRRAGVFLRKYLKSSDKTIFLPQIVGMDDFVEKASGMKIVKNEFLLFELFRIHKEISQRNGNDKYQSFEEFIPFADMILKDFSDIDLHMVDAEQLYTHLSNEKELDMWDVSHPETMSEFQIKYLNFFHSLYEYYTSLHDILNKANKAYSAMIYRNVAENIDTYADAMQWQKVLFVGFCEVSQSEGTIIKTLIRRGMAEFIADGDDFYYKDADNEAGMMLRKNNETFETNKTSFGEHFGDGNRNFNFVSCPENILQSEYVGNIATKIAETKNVTKETEITENNNPFEDTAIVLCDENLLVPTLNALPQNINKVNITMGFPYIFSLTHDLVHKMFEAYDSYDEKRGYNVKKVIQFISHHLIEKHLKINNLESTLAKQFAAEKTYYLKGNELLEKIKTLQDSDLRFLFKTDGLQTAALIEMFERVAQNIYQSCNDSREEISLAAAYQMFEHFAELQEQYSFADSIGVLRRIYDRIAMCMTLSFKGEPVEGLQFMGLQETKNIDFRNLIVVSCNEGIIPKGNTHNSLIPFNLRKIFGMFTYEERDAAEAYNFYRLLQRAENVDFLYNTDTSGSSKSEASRFLAQIKTELSAKYPNITITEKTLLANQQTDSQPFALVKEKTDEVMTLLLKKAQQGHGLTPSSLNKFRKCSLHYYYENILGIRESYDLDEDLDSSELGSYIHAVLEKIFTPFKGKKIAPNQLPDNDTIDKMVEDLFNQEIFDKTAKRSGENYFMLEIAKTQVKTFIRQQKEDLKSHTSVIVDLEKDLTIDMPLTEIFGTDTPNLLKDIKIKPHGVTDRIETIEGVPRIGDYKSGTVKESDLAMKYEEFNIEEQVYIPEKISDKMFQVLYYTWLYWRLNKPQRIEAGIYPLQDTKNFFLKARTKAKEKDGDDTISFTEKHMQLFETYVLTLFHQLFSQDVPFEQNPSNNNCNYCPFANLCGVEKAEF